MKKFLLIAGFVFFSGSQLMAQSEAVDLKETATDLNVKITGMTCGGCASQVSGALDKVEGVLENNVQFSSETALVKYDPALITEGEVIAAITATGYGAEVVTGAEQSSTKEKKEGCKPGGGKSCCASK